MYKLFRKFAVLIITLTLMKKSDLITILASVALACPSAAFAENYTTITSGELNICQQNTSSSYVTYATPLSITAEYPLTVFTSRYTEFKPNIIGDGSLTMMCGGERTFIGDQNGSAYPDWSAYTGDIHIYPYKEVEANAGFYGLILNHGGKRFNPEDIAGSLPTTNAQLINNRVYIHEGGTLATPTGIRGVRIGELNIDAGGRLYGSIKASSSNASYIVVGASGTDALWCGRIAPAEKNGAPDPATLLGIVKEGDGSYRITGNDNYINGGIRILQGTVLIANDIQAAQTDKLDGAIGALAKGTPGVYVFEGANFGGSGNCAAVVDLYGNLLPGDNAVGTLHLADYKNGNDVDLRLRPTSKLYFDINADAADALDVTGALDFYNIDQNFSTSDLTPIIYLLADEQSHLKAGDSFTLITAKGKTSLDQNGWDFRIQYPKAYTWAVEERLTDDGYALVATVTSEEYSGQGDIIIDDGNGEDDVFGNYDDGFDEKKDRVVLRKYADMLDKNIGVAVSTWRYTPEGSDVGTSIGRQFNMVVAENEMKFDATEPSRNSFSYSGGDRIVNFALDNGAQVRGHALAWHKQMPEWLSSDGGVKNNNNFTREELLEILNNHITNVVGHYKGKIREWDVVNECLSDDQSIIRTDPAGYSLRQSIWYTGIGEDYIDSAFVYAHRADPDALLILNEYGGEFKGVAKTEALYNLAKRLKDSGIPIHGVGLQCHLDVGDVNGAKILATFDKYQQIGLTCRITELDLGIDANTDEALDRQARDYYALTLAMASHPNCAGLTIWGYSDDYSWRSGYPLLWDSNHAIKPAYYGVHKALRQQASENGITDITSGSAQLQSVRYYNLQGQPLLHPQPGTLTITVSTYTDGTTHTQKSLTK